MATFHRFEEIEAWQTARQLTKAVYDLTSKGPFSRDFGLREQMRRAAVSIMSNIAEGFESRTSAVFRDFLRHAKGSAGELRAQFYVALDAGYITQAEFDPFRALCERCSGQISGLSSYLRSVAAQKRSASGSSTFEPSNLQTFKRPAKPSAKPS